ncbi:MAG: hypothetical protein LBH07_09010, partial [Treponema sp.]|nr:hypothetical protein [Treponema sp.]
MNKTSRLLLQIFFYFLVLFPAKAQQRKVDPWWLILEEGKRHFRTGIYGDALRSFENARENRKKYYSKMEQDLINVLSI